MMLTPLLKLPILLTLKVEFFRKTKCLNPHPWATNRTIWPMGKQQSVSWKNSAFGCRKPRRMSLFPTCQYHSLGKLSSPQLSNYNVEIMRMMIEHRGCLKSVHPSSPIDHLMTFVVWILYIFNVSENQIKAYINWPIKFVGVFYRMCLILLRRPSSHLLNVIKTLMWQDPTWFLPLSSLKLLLKGCCLLQATKPTTLISFFDISVQIMVVQIMLIQISSEDNSNILSIFATSNYLSDNIQNDANIIC